MKQPQIHEMRANEMKAIGLLVVGIILLISLISFVPEDLPWYTSNPNVPTKNLIRITGAYLAGGFLFTFGYGAYFFALLLFFLGWNKFSSRNLQFSLSKIVSIIVLSCVLSSLFGMMGAQAEDFRFERAGIVGYLISDFLVSYVGVAGTYIILVALGVLTLIVIGEFLVTPLVQKLMENFTGFMSSLKDRAKVVNKEIVFKTKTRPSIKGLEPVLNKSDLLKNKVDVKKEIDQVAYQNKKMLEEAKQKTPPKPQIKIIAQNGDKEKSLSAVEEEPQLVGEYHPPSLDLLKDPPQISTGRIQNELQMGAQILEDTLADFGVSVHVADIERGPVITRYELEPAPGVKVQKITTLENDIALAMRAQTVRIVAPIPGKNRVGIEVPNGASANVYLKDVLSQSEFRSSGSKLMLALGKEISGQPLIADLEKMPHLLIAGTTGSGKTVCVNSIIMSMLFNASPEEVKFLMVDPKMVELTQYNDIPHLLCPAVTDSKRVSAALNWVVTEMENRYMLLSKSGVRNIQGYHALGNKMPYIVVIIDELADLMQVAAKTIESAITRLAQLARAVGIHMILATQRPSVDVITGVIKANFPARISFKVASKVDSRTVLDMNGAESLLGRGDLLFMQPGDAKPVRGQCSFVSDEEIKKVIEFIKSQQKPIYDEEILQNQKIGMGGVGDQKDELYDDALKLVLETNQASVSILQRRMRLGYTRAARLIDMMEQNGIVGPYCGSKPRDILIDREEWLLNNMGKQEKENERDDNR